MNDLSIVYERIREVPQVVRSATYIHYGWVVGGAANYMCGLTDFIRDWDVIVPPHEWSKFAKTLPYKSMTNTFGGIKLIDSIEIDLWPEDLGRIDVKAGGLSYEEAQKCVDQGASHPFVGALIGEACRMLATMELDEA